jgi:predicted  nucleic acid-binding Zn-ribbon protein
MTQREILDSLLHEIKHIKTHMPNGELKQMARDFENMKEDISDLKYTMLNPDNGVIVNTNKNTDFRKKIEGGEKEFQVQVMEVEELKRWKNGVNKALWILFTVVAGIIIRMLIAHSDKIQ